jgi:hypothetical protein
MNWTFLPAAEAFDQTRQDWDALNRSLHGHILLDSGMVGPLIRHFGAGEVVLGVSRHPRRPGMVLLVKKGPAMWETFQPSPAPLGLINLGHPDDRGEAMRELLNALPGYPLQLGVLAQDPDYPLVAPSTSDGRGIQVVDYIPIARVPLGGTFEEYWQNRSANLKHNLSRQRRRLAEQGSTLELATYRAAENIGMCMREYGRLEGQGWKGQAGTAVAEDNAQGRFYREVLETFCAKGEGVVFLLRLDGKVIASDLCLARNGMLVVLKTAYDQTVERLSPALLMRQEIIQQLYAEKQVQVVEFYGPVMDWHTKWTDQIRMMYHLNCFRGPWVPKVKDLAKRLASLPSRITGEPPRGRRHGG